MDYWVFSSCEKSRPGAEACIDTGSSTLKSGSAIRFMNCSKYYDATSWYVINGADITDTLFNEVTDTLKHMVYTFGAPGNFNVVLNVRQRENASENTITQNVNITTP